MSTPNFNDHYPNSPAFQAMQPLRVPSGWRIDWHKLHIGMDADLSQLGGSSLYNATNEGRRFNVDVQFIPEFDPEGAFYLVVLYQPWPRTDQGRRRGTTHFAIDADAECVHESETRSYPELIARLEHWIARCTVWQREGN